MKQIFNFFQFSSNLSMWKKICIWCLMFVATFIVDDLNLKRHSCFSSTSLSNIGCEGSEVLFELSSADREEILGPAKICRRFQVQRKQHSQLFFLSHKWLFFPLVEVLSEALEMSGLVWRKVSFITKQFELSLSLKQEWPWLLEAFSLGLFINEPC